MMARALAPVADVTILTASSHEESYHELRALGDARVDYGGAAVTFVAVPEPGDRGGFHSDAHLYSHRVTERLRGRFGKVGPDLVEFPDRSAEGFIATQARRGGDPLFARTVLAVRLHTSSELRDILNGYLDRSFESRLSRELERQTLRDADVLLAAGGDVLGTYRRFYGGALAPARTVRYPFEWDERPCRPSRLDGPLRMLCVGPCERRRGVQDLISAVISLAGDWRLTIAADDTRTAPLGRSMRGTLELQADDDPRISFEGPVARGDLTERLRRHDVVVLSSRWECWPYIALDAMAAGVPVVAPANGGCVEMVKPGVAGWLADGSGSQSLSDTLGPLVAEPRRAREAIDPLALRDHLRRLTDPEAIRAAYLELIDEHAPPGGLGPAPPAAPPLVSVVIPYYGMARFVEDTVASVFTQTHRRLEVLVVDDGSVGPEDVVLAELAVRYPLRILLQPNGGLGAARNFGIAQSRGRYVLPLDADNVLEPTFVERCVTLLEADETLAFVTSWNRYIGDVGIPFNSPNEGYRPVGNWTALVEEQGIAGDGVAVFRRSVFDAHAFSEDLTSFEDWALYRALRRAGQYGRVIPEMLWRYRVREDSMLRQVGIPHEVRLLEEMNALTIEQEMTWASTSG